MKKLQVIIIFTFLLFPLYSQAQVGGCLDPEACNFEPNINFNDGSCTDEPVWFIPSTPTESGGDSPALLTCGAPEHYILAVQSCIIQVIEADPFCINFTWDQTCQSTYESNIAYATGCSEEGACNYEAHVLYDDGSCIYEPAWYIPAIPTAFNGSSPAMLSCEPIPGYVVADQCCVSALIIADDFCVDITWDETCQTTYDACVNTGNVLGCADPEACNYVECVNRSNGSCIYEQWYIPNALGSSPVVLSCNSIAGFTLANQCAIESVIANDSFCLDNSYDATCQESYNFLLSQSGCTDLTACNYDFFANCDSGECDYGCLGCTNADACNYDPFATHFENYCDYFSCEDEDEFFITKWQTVEQNELISFKPNMEFIESEPSLSLDYFVDWGDGTYTNHVTGVASHIYETPNVYDISVRGNIPAIEISNQNEQEPRILEITQWGSNNWKSMSFAFYNCINMDISATDVPDLSDVTSCIFMFGKCDNLTNGLFDWDVSNVTNMRYMFFSTNEFNADISSWNVSNVTDMESMFSYARKFNQDIGAWNVSNVTNMTSMLEHTADFVYDIGEWDVSNVTDMSRMFSGSSSFNHDIDSWDVSNVTDMSSMFAGNRAFFKDLGSWDVSSVTDMSNMFAIANHYNGDLTGWDVSSVTDMSTMFSVCIDFDQDISSWDVSNVTEMNGMFSNAESFNQDIGGWDVSSVTNMERMLAGADSFNQDIGSWDVSNVTNMELMLAADNFNQDIGGWDVSNVTTMEAMLAGTDSFNQDIGSWDVSAVTNMDGMFFGAESFDQNISLWDVSAVTNMREMFIYTESFNHDIESWNVSNVTTMSGMFNSAIFNQSIGDWDVSNVTDMNAMFAYNNSFDQDLSSWDMSSVNTMSFFLSDSGMSTENYDLLLLSLANQTETLQPNVNFGAQGIYYCTSEDERTILTNEPLNWTVTDAGQLCPETCAGDIDSDGYVTSSDLSAFLAAFGTVGESPADLNGDGAVNVADLGLFLGVFGSECL